MNDDVINRKMESLRNCLLRIEGKLPFSIDDLENNFDLQDIVSLNLERAVQCCVDIGAYILSNLQGPTPTTMSETFELLQKAGKINPELSLNLKKAVGLRNMLVHEYSNIKWPVIHNVCHNTLHVFKDFGATLLQHNPSTP